MGSKDNFETLDPQDWDAMRELGLRMMNDAVDYLQTVGERPVWQPIPAAIEQSFDDAAPQEPGDPAAIYEDYLRRISPYPMGNIHPRFWAWYMGNGTVMGAFADLLAATMNPNMGGGNHSAALVEAQVITWIKELMDYPADSSGLLVSGGSMANLVGLTIARNSKAGIDLRKNGLQALSKRLTVYASQEVHSCNQKAIEMLGLGSEHLRKIPVDPDFRINLDALKNTITADLEAGFQPICIIASSGTVNTGAIDDLNAIADLCEQHQLWFHVDGAIGAIGQLSELVRPQLSGLQRADSIALDLHKWMHIPFEAGCVLVRNAQAHRDSFALTPAYLEHGTRGIASGPNWFSEYGPQLSRSFRALKIWMTMKEHGSKKLGRMMTRNVQQAQYLGTLIEAAPDLELVAPIGLDIVCYRYNPGGQSLEALNALNREILLQLQEQGIAAPSETTLNGVYCIRVAIANHRSRNEDFEVLAKESRRLGKSIIKAR